MWQSIPDLGTGLLLVTLVAAAYTIALSIAAAAGTSRLLRAARHAAYGTAALITSSVLVLAYAFVTHDFRISYVARYSDRSMPLPFLLSALWGGQDGSMLWWLFLLGLFVAATVAWLRDRYLSLQPYVIATMMTTVVFFCLVMAFAADPFALAPMGARLDGSGLNPLLQTFYMAIHPPSLYVGFVATTVPFAFAVAALLTGQLDNAWLVAVRKWMLVAWLFLTIGNGLGMLWAYVELGWGGYWGWDPVENASLLPWLTATAYLHSAMVQERRGMFKVWNVVLIATTFFLTIFGTFLTRSGVIASVHAFARSELGTYFLYYLGIILAGTVALVLWRLPLLRSDQHMESASSRDAAFLAGNLAFVAATAFIGIATTFPMISEALLRETVTFQPAFYNRWMPLLGLLIFLLMGLTPLLGWRKTSQAGFRKAILVPAAASVIFALAHIALGARLGMPAIITPEAAPAGASNAVLTAFTRIAPLLTSTLVAFNAAVILQEFVRGAAARSRALGISWPEALVQLIIRSRRRYGGYLAHLGVTLMFIGFLGQAWGLTSEASLARGQSHSIGNYTLRFDQAKIQVDTSKQMTFADLTVTNNAGKTLGTLSPAKFLYRTHPSQPTTEIAVLHSVRDDLYVVLGSISQDGQRIAIQAHVNPFVSWIWAGLFVVGLGAIISLWPSFSWGESRARGLLRFASLIVSIMVFALLLASWPYLRLSRHQEIEPQSRLEPAEGIGGRLVASSSSPSDNSR